MSFLAAITERGRRKDAADGWGSKHGTPILKFDGAIVLMMGAAASRSDRRMVDNIMVFRVRCRFALGVDVEGDGGLRGEAYRLLRRG